MSYSMRVYCSLKIMLIIADPDFKMEVTIKSFGKYFMLDTHRNQSIQIHVKSIIPTWYK